MTRQAYALIHFADEPKWRKYPIKAETEDEAFEKACELMDKLLDERKARDML